MKTVRLTTAQALVRWLIAQRTVVEDEDAPLFPGVFAIFGHGNVTSLGQALEAAGDALPTWRGQNEQGMALAAVAYAKAKRRRQVMVATSSIGPGATNMVTAAAVAHANRLPLLLLCGDTFASRIPDPVLQQIERPDAPAVTANDAFRPVTRYWDRIMRPEQLVQSLPQALATMLDPGDCGPALLALPQDVQAEAYDFPDRFFERTVHSVRRARADRHALDEAAVVLRQAKRPLVIAGGGVHYSLATDSLASFAAAHALPVVETVAGKAALPWDHPNNAGPLGVMGSPAANGLAASADVVLAVGTRLQDFTTGSWTVFGDEDLRIVTVNTARLDAVKHRALALVGDARETLAELGCRLEGWQADSSWLSTAQSGAAERNAEIDSLTAAPAADAQHDGLPTYAQVVGAAHRSATADDYVVASSGGFPGELNSGWRALAPGTFDCEYGFSTMGYEIAGAWGARMARSAGEVFAFVGDGSYLMMNSDLYSTVLTGQKIVAIVCDNGGYAVIERLQVAQGGAPFNNLWDTTRVVEHVPVDFAAHAASMGCQAERVHTIAELEHALQRARSADRTTVIAIRTDPHAWVEGGAFWEVGVPEVSDRPEVRAALEAKREATATQRVGW